MTENYVNQTTANLKQASIIYNIHLVTRRLRSIKQIAIIIFGITQEFAVRFRCQHNAVVFNSPLIHKSYNFSRNIITF